MKIYKKKTEELLKVKSQICYSETGLMSNSDKKRIRQIDRELNKRDGMNYHTAHLTRTQEEE